MNQIESIKSLTPEERPYEKCELYGVSALTNIELLAILLRSGTKGESSLSLAKKILQPDFSQEEGLLSLHRWSMEKLKELKGIGRVKGIQIMSLLELSKRLSMASAKESLCFSSPETIATYYMEEMRHHRQEVLKLLLLNTKNRLIGSSDISKGTVNSAIISPRELFIDALEKNAVAIILIHNHPSGDPTPSHEDILLTKRISDAGKLIGIELLDHLVIGNNCYISLQEKGYI